MALLVRRALFAVAATLLLTTSCTTDQPDDAAPAPPGPARMVVLGDSMPSPTACLGCPIFPTQVAEALAEQLGREVDVVNLSKELRSTELSGMGDILAKVRTHDEMQEALTGATAVLIMAGQNDLAYNRADDPCGVAPRYPRVRWEELTNECMDSTLVEYEAALEALLAEIARVNTATPMVRVVSVFNTALGDRVDPTWNSPQAVGPSTYNVSRMVEIQCAVAARTGGQCVDLYHVLNGPDGLRSAQRYLSPLDATHLDRTGHDRVAQAVISVGFRPLVSGGP